jgi:hypothetical protein
VLLVPRGATTLYQVTRETREVASYAIADDGALSPLGAPATVPSDDLPNGAAILPSCRRDIRIDVRPGSLDNPIHPSARGVIPVAIFGAPDLDVTAIVAGTLRFGPGNAFPAHDGGHLDDLDLDGRVDLVVHFRTRDAGIACGDTGASVIGETRDGCTIEGTDTIRTVGNCR